MPDVDPLAERKALYAMLAAFESEARAHMDASFWETVRQEEEERIAHARR